MIPFLVLHHYCLQNENLNVLMQLNRYITHPTGAGPGGLQPHMGAPPDQAWSLWV